MVNRKRLEENFYKLSMIGAQNGGGITRLAFSDEDWEARKFVRQLMEHAGLQVRIDTFGNMIGRHGGFNPQASVVMLGSHIDSVPNGGNFDGAVGVLGAIEAVQCFIETGKSASHPIEVVVFMAEESSRFGAATLGSKAFCGKLTFAELNQYVDRQGISVAEAMRKRGLQPEQISQSCYGETIEAFLELHIEQGMCLEAAKTQIGIVTGIAAPTRLWVAVNGRADHSGATPMNMRRDALAAAAEIILAVEKLTSVSLHGTVGTTGIIHAEPGVMNVIPGRVELGIDLRSIYGEDKQQILRQIEVEIDGIRMNRKVAIEVRVLTDEQPVRLNAEMIEMLSSVCESKGCSSMLLPSGAGHDAMHLAAIARTGMIFIPCRGGISHNPAEWADIKDIAAGTEILLAAICELAG